MLQPLHSVIYLFNHTAVEALPLHSVRAGRRLGRALSSDDRGVDGFDEGFDIPRVWTWYRSMNGVCGGGRWYSWQAMGSGAIGVFFEVGLMARSKGSGYRYVWWC
jgi:hypothetical protein